MAHDRILSERYRVEETLGEGGMARVYRGTDQVLGRTVAIKVLADRHAGDDKFVTRFRREAQAAAALNHPNVVSVFDTGDDGQAHYIVMEYVEGETLADLLRRERPLDPGLAARIAEEVATALHAAHDRQLVHRDVKPGNVMIDREGRIKVMDFGIARAAADDTLTATGTVLGTASYLSPEQARGDPVDARSDIYSLGCVLYEMLSGRAPFTGDSAVSIAFRHVNDRPDPPSVHHPGIPPELEAVTMRALEKDPARRQQSAEELRQALAAARAAGVDTGPMGAGGDTDLLPVAAPPDGTTPITAEPTPPDLHRRPRFPSWLPLALIAAAVLALAGILALTLAGDEEGPRRGQGRQGQGQGPPPPEEESPPPEETSPPPAEPVAPEEALGALDNVLVAAVTDGSLTVDAAEKIGDKATAASEKYAAGDLTGALDELNKAKEELAKAASEGQVTSSETAAQITQAIDAVAASMEAAPPTLPPEGGGDGDD
jgi:tRNA A-37 threonylcarbamoyl transferase component Bud32